MGKEYAPHLFDLTLRVECNKEALFLAADLELFSKALPEKKVTTYPHVDTTFPQ